MRQIKMTIERCDWPDILEILHETGRIWSAGLTQSKYHEYINTQLSHKWSRKNFYYLALRLEGRIAASLKVYHLKIAHRGRSLDFAGIGAVYTCEAYRKRGLASRLIQHVIDTSTREGAQGVMLFSDIDPDFYGDLGFFKLGHTNFVIDVTTLKERTEEKLEEGFDERPLGAGNGGNGGNGAPAKESQARGHAPWKSQAQHKALAAEDIPFMERHYRRWLRTQPFGVERSEQYWSYKVEKEEFLAVNSRLDWPGLQLIKMSSTDLDSSYVIWEFGNKCLRVLEIVAPPSMVPNCWNEIVMLALSLKAERIRGWEGLLGNLAPSFSLKNFVNLPASAVNQPVECEERSWGVPMMYAIDEEIEKFVDFFPCPLLELDHI